MNKMILMTALAGALAVAGCVSVEKTRRQLESSDPQEVQRAERNILAIVKSSEAYNEQTQIEYVNLVSDNDLLLEIIDIAYRNSVAAAAAGRLDLSQPGIGVKLLTEYTDKIHNVKDLKTERALVDVVVDSLDEKDLALVLDAEMKDHDYDKYAEHRVERMIMRVLAVTKDVDLVSKLFDADMCDYKCRKAIAVKLASMYDKIDDDEMILKLLNGRNGNTRYVDKSADRAKLISRLSDVEAVNYAIGLISDSWKFVFDDVAIVLKKTNKPDLVKKIVPAICDNRSEEQARELLKQIPKLDDKTVAELVCMDGMRWRYVMDLVSANVAYEVLASGKAKSVDLEMALVKKLPKDRFDMKIYNATKQDSVRKALYENMSPELRKSIGEARNAKFKSICEKAKAAAKETFELDGFYLGMDFEDAKVVFSHHFPSLEIEEGVDGSGKNEDHVIYVPGQRSPFCYASVSDKKVYLFNFGKKLLKKWYQYDVQTPAEWSIAYSREMKIDMNYKTIEKDTEVYDQNLTTSYRVWFHQASYQYRHNMKDYRLIYFGEEKEFTGVGGIGGALIKEQAARDFRYVRGDPGSLRVRIERD